ncbi:MAG: hypothetical protein U1F98_12830 [Verrucomicrobiota bacterium]
MKSFFKPNLAPAGRRARATTAVLLLLAAAGMAFVFIPAAIALAISACFVAFEAARGWCVLRACGIKTRL